MLASTFTRPTKASSTSTFTCFFFVGNMWWVRLLQLLVGGSWNSPSHVAYALNNCSYEITTEGVEIGQTEVGALYRACVDSYSFELTPAQAFILSTYFDCLQQEEQKFDLWECVRYCWTLLTSGCLSVFVYLDWLPYGGAVRVQPYETAYCPPFSCTAPMWEAMGEQPPAWNSFAVSTLYNHLTNATLSFEGDDLE